MKKWLMGIAMIIILGGIVFFSNYKWRGHVIYENITNETDEQETSQEILGEEDKRQAEEFEEATKEKKFYEDITMVENLDSYLVLVNKNHALSSGYSPTDLVLPDILDIRYQVNSTLYLREEAAYMIEQLFQAAYEEAGLTLLARSGYRSYQTQNKLYQDYVRDNGQESADWFSARPGHSEHQTGLTMDVTSASVNGQLEIAFGETVEGQWLAENAHRFGYIIRYPLGRELDTGYQYEPWHIRYVGVEAATEIYGNDIILEEYLDQW